MNREKTYELSNHLGNVLTVVSDRKIAVVNSGATDIDHFTGEILTANDYYAFGFEMKGRSVNAGTSYAYGFNGKRKDNEITVDGGDYDFGDRILDTRLGRWFSADPMRQYYASIAPYAAFGNSPIYIKDLEGRILIDPWGHPIFIDHGLCRPTEIHTVDDKGKPIIIVQQTKSYTYFTNAGEPIHALQVISQTQYPAKEAEDGTFIKASNTGISLEVPKNQLMDCHGLVLLYRLNTEINVQGGSHSSNNITGILKQEGYVQLETFKGKTLSIDMKKNGLNVGDVFVFTNSGGVSHSAILNADGTFTSKNGTGKLYTNISFEDLKKEYANENDPNSNVEVFQGGGKDVTITTELFYSKAKNGETYSTKGEVKMAAKKEAAKSRKTN